jgi:hypothetical protein
MRRTASGLFIAPSFNILRFRAREKTVTLPNGERAKVTYDDSGTVRHTEHGDHLDALVRPAPIRIKLHLEQVNAAVGGFGRPSSIRTRFKQRLKD